MNGNNKLQFESELNIMECLECYSEDNTKKPRLGNLDCLENHEQYICGTCGRCICIDEHPERKLRRWNFPFKTFEVAKLYLRTADYTTKQCCGIYEIINKTGRKSYKIFAHDKEMLDYLKKNKDKKCTNNKALFRVSEYKEFPNTEIRKLTKEEANDYWNKRFLQITIYKADLLSNINKIHTTEMGIDRIKKNLKIDTNDVVEYCKNKILDKNCNIYKQGKNWYCEIDNIRITINSYNYTIITAHTIR